MTVILTATVTVRMRSEGDWLELPTLACAVCGLGWHSAAITATAWASQPCGKVQQHQLHVHGRCYSRVVLEVVSGKYGLAAQAGLPRHGNRHGLLSIVNCSLVMAVTVQHGLGASAETLQQHPYSNSNAEWYMLLSHKPACVVSHKPGILYILPVVSCVLEGACTLQRFAGGTG